MASIASVAAWKIHLFGAFRLIDPESNQLDLKSKKLESLLAILVVSQPYGLSRDEICAIVWPNTEAKQNLRQALYALRKILGPNAIEATLDHCRLGESFNFTCDFHESKLRDSATFMPSCVGTWFDEVRTGIESDGIADEEPSAMDGFADTLSWYAQNDPRGFYTLLRTSPNMVRGIPFAMLKHLSDVAFKANPHSLGWSLFWRGSAEENLLLSAKFLRKALQEAQVADDAELASEVALELGKVYARLGKPDHAMQVCKIAETIALSSNAKGLVANSLQLKGTILTYYGHSDKGVNAMIQGEDLLDDTLGIALARGRRAYFLASVGRNEEAQDVLQWPLRVTSGLGHKRMANIAGMTQGIIAANEGSTELAVKMLEKILDDMVTTGFTQFGVCAADLLEKIYTTEGENQLALSKKKSAQQGRSLSKAVKTPLEVQRQSLASK